MFFTFSENKEVVCVTTIYNNGFDKISFAKDHSGKRLENILEPVLSVF